MKYNILVGTYHKTGSVWMYNVFQAIAKKLKVPFVHITAHTEFYQKQLKSPQGVSDYLNSLSHNGPFQIIFDDHSHFGEIDASQQKGFRGFRVVRDPLAVICSSAKYHCWSKESWLHIELQRFGGKSYQSAINELPDMNSRYQFEMENTAGQTIEQMGAKDTYSFIKMVKYEALIKDNAFVEFVKVLAYLGLEGTDVIKALECFYEHSTFGGVNAADMSHIQNDQQKIYGSDWDEKTRELYLNKYSRHIKSLDYSPIPPCSQTELSQTDV